MSLRLVLGRAGSGKTRSCLDEIKGMLEESVLGPPLIVLVPEQATFQMERALVQHLGARGTIRAQVLSFRRLAWRVLAEVGGASRPHLNELGRQMVLRRILEQNQERLGVFQRSAHQPGFDETLSRLLSELKTYGVVPGRLRDVIAGGDVPGQDSQLNDKLRDVALVYSEMEDYLQERYTDPDDYLWLLAERLPLSEAIRGAVFWLDGFTGFTAQEYAVLERLLQVAERIQVNLCLDSASISHPLKELEVFHPTRETYRRLLGRARELGVEVEQPLFLNYSEGSRFNRRPALAHLESAFFKRPAAVFAGEPNGLKLVAGTSRAAEIEAAAREITRLARDEGYRWREVAVLLRDLESYHQQVAAVFQDYGIPFFLDRKREADHHPLVELINSAFETVIRGWTYEPLFRYLKTDLVPLTRDEVDRLENYVLAHGIKGSRWYDGSGWADPRGYYFGGREIDELRLRAVSGLVEFQRVMKAQPTLRQVAEAVAGLLFALEVPERLEEWTAQAEKQGRLEAAREHSQVWQGVVDLLEQLVESLGDESLPLEQTARVMETGLAGIRLSLIPPALDQVIVGSLDRSRQPELRAAFLLGVNEGVLPARPPEDGLLSESEREQLRGMGIELAPSSSRRLLDEQYLIYQGLTRSSEYLWVSYLLADDEGKAMLPSMVVRRIREIFPDLAEESIGIEPSGPLEVQLGFIANPERVVSYLTRQLRDARNQPGERLDPLWSAVISWVTGRPAWRERWAVLERSLDHRNQTEPIEMATSRLLYGFPFTSSVSRLEKYRSCPFAHYAAFGLRLEEREMFKLEAPDMGQFFHACLKGLGDRLIQESLDWGSLRPGECRELIDQVVREVVPGLQHDLLQSSARYRYLTRKLGRTVERAALTLAEHGRRSGFHPVGLELAFGSGEHLPPLRIDLSGGDTMEIRGQIDRLDCAHSGDKSYLRVIDYKSGTTSLDLSEVYHGISLQLLTYLDVGLVNASGIIGREAEPAGMLYFPVRDPLINGSAQLSDEEIERQILRRLKMKGIVLADPEVARLMDRAVGSSSDIVPLGIKKDGGFSSRSSVLDRNQFASLRRHLRSVLQESGREILEGGTRISPYRRGDRHACQYCSYRPVCQFDQLVEGNRYRWLKDAPPGFPAEAAKGGDRDGNQ
ncbi:MAG: helicase-exonuclease AddAB subunit AddB [Firmicutes bacterium]|nr:helicase-exonuclease AddAB subunit AddB [Bacillota bacterium]